MGHNRMINEEDKLTLIKASSDLMTSAGEYFTPEHVFSDFVDWTGIYPADEREKHMMSIVAATLELPISTGCEQSILQFEKTIKKQSVKRETLYQFRENPLEPVQYNVFHDCGVHQILFPWGTGIDSRGFYSFHEKTLVESDDWYCCPMCDGYRTPDSIEYEVPGYYIGWRVFQYFIAFSRIDKKTYLNLSTYQGLSNDELSRTSLRAALAPWEF